MTRSAEILLNWGDEERPFRLGLKQLERLQEKCGERGPNRILRDLLSQDWKVRDILETIRLGLVGAGTSLPDADKLCREYVEERPLSENVFVAVAILQAAIVGPPIQDLAPPGARPPGEAETATARSTSLSSTETEQSSAGVPPQSVN